MEVDPEHTSDETQPNTDHPLAFEGGYDAADSTAAEDDAAAADFLPGDYPEPLDDDMDDTAEGKEAVPDRPPQEIRMICVREGKEAVAEVLEQLRSGQDPHFPSDIAGLIVADSIKDAATANDASQVEAHLAELLRLPYVDMRTKLDGCYMAAQFGSDDGRVAVRGYLAAERERLLHLQAEGYLDYNQGAVALQQLVEICIEANTDPTEWIEEFAVTDMHEWQLKLGYHDAMAHNGSPEVPLHQREVDALAQELCMPGVFPEDFVHARSADALTKAVEPEVRERLVDTFICSDVPPTLTSYQQLIRMAGITIQDPLLKTDENVGVFRRDIEDTGQLLQEMGVDPFLIAREQMPLKAQLMLENGGSAQEVVDTLDQAVSALFTMPSTPRRAPGRLEDHRKLMEERELLIEIYAVQFARAGDFAGARLALSYATDEYRKEDGFMRCLEQATTTDQANQMRSDEAPPPGGADPDMDRWFQFTDARLSDDPDALPVFARTQAATMDDGTGDFDPSGAFTPKGIANDQARGALQRTLAQYAAIHPDQAPALAAELLAIVRERGVPYPTTTFLTYAATAGGSEAEAAQAYDAIMGMRASNPVKILYKWELSRHIGNN